MTDRAVSLRRESNFERTTVHYMQPHYPFIADGASRDEQFSFGHAVPHTGDRDGRWEPGDTGRNNPWRAYRRNEIEYDELMASYRRNLRLVLEEVTRLLANTDVERAVLTTDHGNAVGELGIYGHPPGFLHPSVKRVPWVVTAGEDTGFHDPEITQREAETGNVEGVLQALGYT